MIQKRRVIYMTDQEWALLKASAEKRGESVSQIIRNMWKAATSPAAEASAFTPVGNRSIPDVDGVTFNVDRPAQQERDAILKRVNRKTGE